MIANLIFALLRLTATWHNSTFVGIPGTTIAAGVALLAILSIVVVWWNASSRPRSHRVRPGEEAHPRYGLKVDPTRGIRRAASAK